LQRRGGIIVEKLCDLIPSENVIMPLVNQIKDLKDNRLRRMLIQVINVLLLTSEKTKGCRTLLQSKESDDFLRNLLSGFSSSISASISVILLSRNYDVACVFIEMVAEGVFQWEMSEVLVELTQLTTLFESPGFASVRLNLMDEKKHSSLRKCMLAILMMLPQGDAFDMLFKRLQLVLGTSYSSSSGSKNLLSEHGIDMLKYKKTAELTSKQKDLLDIFLLPKKDL
jgi:vacuole morphology and inheritance protein 14